MPSGSYHAELAAHYQAVRRRFANAAPKLAPGPEPEPAAEPDPAPWIGERTTIGRIQRLICAQHKVTLADLTSPRRNMRVTVPRQLAMYLADRLLRASPADIGRRFDRDRTTVLHAIERIASDAGLLREAHQLAQMLGVPLMPRRKIERIQIVSTEQWLGLREHDVTASRIGALFGCHPYETLAGLAMAKRGVVLPDHDSAVLRRGRILESAVAAAVREEKPTWRVAKLNIYLRDRLLRLGATPDFAVTDEQGRRGILQAKTVAPLEFKRHWSDGVPPFWITLQCLTESMLDDAAIGYVAALVVDYTCPLHIFEIPRHAGAEARIRQRVAEFWQDVEAGREPKIDYERDGALVAAMYPHHVEGKAIDLRHDNRMPELLAARDALAERIRESEADKDVIENEIKSKIGDAETAIVPGWRVSLREQHRKEHTVRASSFRVLRTAKEQEKAA